MLQGEYTPKIELMLRLIQFFNLNEQINNLKVLKKYKYSTIN